MPEPTTPPASSSADAGDTPAKSFGGYEIEKELGRGGMGVVYLARQIELNRPVALKMLSGRYGPRELHRFVAEAETAAALHHNNIAHIYEVGEHEGAPFYSMEYVKAGSLADRLRKNLPPPEEAAELLIQVARALHFAHQNGVVHRDMKPANILLDAEGIPKIADFGIAKRLKDDSRFTRTGDVIGTPTYMAPEQAKGTSRHVGPPADVYAMGAILYELLTGRPPFLPEDSETAITVRVLTEDPVSPAWHQPDTPRDLETICMKCLEKDPRHRYHDAAGLAEDLRRYLDDEPILARPPNTLVRSVKWVRRHPWKLIGAVAAALLLAAVVLWVAYWILYQRTRTEYASSIQTVHGRMEPATPLSAADASRRQYSIRVTRRGLLGPITRVEAVNPRGRPAAMRQIFNYDVLPNWLEGLAGMAKQDERPRETTAIEFTFNGNEAVEAVALDRNQNINWRMTYDYVRTRRGENRAQARFLDLRGNDVGQAKGASRVEFDRDAQGHDVGARFFNSGGQPEANAEGAFGYTIEWERGQISRLTYLGRDGKPAPNYVGVTIIALTYNSRGQLTRNHFLGADGKPVLYNGIAAIDWEYDDAGNPLRARFSDVAARPVNSGAGFAMVEYKRNQYGEAIEVVNSRLKNDGTFEPASKRIFEYDANGYPADIRVVGPTSQREKFVSDEVGNITEERLIDLEGKPIAGPNGWSIRRKSFGAAKDGNGWREEETYFDVNGAKAYHQDGYHRQIIEYDETGLPRLLISEEYDSGRFSYYRFRSVSEFAGGKLRRLVSTLEDADGRPAVRTLSCTSVETQFDEDGDEETKWEFGCNVATMGAPVFRTEYGWENNGGTKRIRQALDVNRQPLATIPGGAQARSEEERDGNGEITRIYDGGFDEKVVGFTARECKFAKGLLASVTHTHADGSPVTGVKVFITGVVPQQPKAGEFQVGDQLLTVNGKPATTGYAWAPGKFPGGSVEVMRNGSRVVINGLKPGVLGIAMQDRVK